MKFGIREIYHFASHHSDERVRVMGKRLKETRSKSAKWCEHAAKLEKENAMLREALLTIDSGLEYSRDVICPKCSESSTGNATCPLAEEIHGEVVSCSCCLSCQRECANDLTN